MSKRGPTRPRSWEPLQRARPVVKPEHADAQARIMALTGADRYMEMWMNDQYLVTVSRREDGTVDHLSIRRSDRKAPRDWRDFQRIKNQLAGEDAEAVELYPAQARVVDTANQFHLWVTRPGVRFPMGFSGGLTMDPDDGPEIGAEQRPFDPADPPRDGFPVRGWANVSATPNAMLHKRVVGAVLGIDDDDTEPPESLMKLISSPEAGDRMVVIAARALEDEEFPTAGLSDEEILNHPELGHALARAAERRKEQK